MDWEHVLGFAKESLTTVGLLFGAWISVRAIIRHTKDPRRENLNLDLENLKLARSLELTPLHLETHVERELRALYDPHPREKLWWRVKVWALGIATVILLSVTNGVFKTGDWRASLLAGLFTFAIGLNWIKMFRSEPHRFDDL
jgi:hypothetical protein